MAYTLYGLIVFVRDAGRLEGADVGFSVFSWDQGDSWQTHQALESYPKVFVCPKMDKGG